jgi:Transposase, Mutator family
MAETKRMTAEQVVSFLLEDEGVDFLRESLRWVVQQRMEAEVSELIGAKHSERSEERLTHRNGYRPRRWDTCAGELELAIPKIRRGSYFPSFLEPRRRSEQALVSVIQQAYVCGVSTRKVDQLVESLGLRVSRSEVSRICPEDVRMRVLGRMVTYCSKLTTEEAREVAEALSGLDREQDLARLQYQLAEGAHEWEETEIWFEPYFPHGQVTCSVCG